MMHGAEYGGTSGAELLLATLVLVVVAVAREDVSARRIDGDAVHRPRAHLTDDLAGVGVDDEQRP